MTSAEAAPTADPSARTLESVQPSGMAAEPASPAEFWGRVVSDEDDRPVAGAEIGMRVWERPDPYFRTVTSTDADGTFRWMPEPERLFEVRATGFALASGFADRSHPRRDDAREIRLKRSATLEVHVRSAEDLAGGFVWVDARKPMSTDVDVPDLEWRASLSEDGRAAVSGVTPRVELYLFFSRSDHSSLWHPADPIVLEPGETRVLEVDLRVESKLVVTLRDASGAAVPDRIVSLVRQPAYHAEPAGCVYFKNVVDEDDEGSERTDETGRAVFDRVEPGDWWVGPPITNDDVAPVATYVDVPPGVGETKVELVVQRGLFLRGRVLAPDGTPTDQAFVGAEHDTIRGHVTGDVHIDGRFVLGPVAAGPHRVRALPKGEFLAPVPVLALPNGDEIVIQLLPAAAIAGRVVDATTGKDAFADVVCSRSGDDDPTLATVDGGFRIGGLRPGTYALAAAASDGRVAIVRGIRVEAGDEIRDVRIALEPAARLRLRYRGGPTHANVSLWSDDALVATRELPQGVELECDVPAVRLDVRLESGKHELLHRTIDARAGETTDVLLEIE